MNLFYDSNCLATVIDACSECINLESGLKLNGLVIKLGHSCDFSIRTGLVDLYVKFGNLKSARILFDGVSGKSTASFIALLD